MGQVVPFLAVPERVFVPRLPDLFRFPAQHVRVGGQDAFLSENRFRFQSGYGCKQVFRIPDSCQIGKGKRFKGSAFILCGNLKVLLFFRTVDQFRQFPQSVDNTAKHQDKAAEQGSAGFQYALRLPDRLQSVSLVHQVIQRTHQEDCIKRIIRKPGKIQRVSLHRCDLYAVLPGLLFRKPHVSITQVQQGHRMAFLCIVNRIMSGASSDIQDGVPRPDIPVHHMGGDVFFVGEPFLQPVPFLPGIGVIVLNLPFYRYYKFKQTWSFVFGKLMTDGVWWFFLFWAPAYFSDQYHYTSDSGMGIALIFTLYAIVTVLSIGGGYLPKYFVEKKGMNPYLGRMRAMFIFACFPLLGLLAQPLGTYSPWWPAILIGLLGAGHQAWSANLFSTIGDMFPKSMIATITGIGTMAGGFGSMAINMGSGEFFTWAAEQGKAFSFFGFEGKPAAYMVVFCICAVAYLIGWCIIKTLVPKYKPIELD